jgi:hypothetical protein
MKKFLFLGLAAMMAFTSCTKDETLATAQNGAIGFDVSADKATRSVYDPSISTNGDNATTAITNFAVYGWMEDANGVGGDVFNAEEVTGSNANGWSYTNTQYWTPNTYYFAALAPNADKKWSVETKQSKLGIGTVTFENTGKQDLLYWAGISDNTNNGVEDAPVSIKFNHLLSKVKFSFVNKFENANAKLIVEDIVITNAETEGTIDLAVENWWDGKEDWSVKTPADFEFGNAATTAIDALTDSILVGAEMESYNEMLLFPVNEKEFNITFVVYLYMDGALAGKYNHTVQVTTTLEMGKAYDFKAEINASNVTGDDATELKPIEFKVEVIDWVQPNDVEVKLNEEHKNVTVAAGETMTLACNGTIVGTMNVAGTLDGNGHTLAAEAAPANNGMIRPTGTATVQNVNIDGKGVRTTDDKSIRGIYITTNGNYVIEGVKILNCGYAFNAQTSAQSSLNVSKSTFEGWSSYDLDGKVNVTDVLAEFKEVNFTRGAYEKLVDDQGNLLKNGWLRPYNSTILTNCTFEEGYTIDLGSLVAGGTVKFVNCTYGTTVITAANIESLGFVKNYDAAKVAF